MKNPILIIAHEPIAQALRLGALHVFPECGDWVHALDVPAHEKPEVTLQRAQAVAQKVNHAPMLVLTDMVGATPCNVMSHMLKQVAEGELCAICGVNMPMLLRAVCYADLPLAEMQQRALEGGLKGINMVPAPSSEQA